MLFVAGFVGQGSRSSLSVPPDESLTAHHTRYPHLLPNIVSAIAALVALLMVACFLPETKQAEGKRKNSTMGENIAAQHLPQLYTRRYLATCAQVYLYEICPDLAIASVVSFILVKRTRSYPSLTLGCASKVVL